MPTILRLTKRMMRKRAMEARSGEEEKCDTTELRWLRRRAVWE